jgi:Na+-driven multidrug efflux pump
MPQQTVDESRTLVMMKKLRGRNLAHPGCLIGVTAGLIVGIVLAAILASMNVALNTDLLVWLGLTLGLGLIGWITGDRLSSHFPALDDQASVNEPTKEHVSD